MAVAVSGLGTGLPKPAGFAQTLEGSPAGTRWYPLADYSPVAGRVILLLLWPELSAKKVRSLSSRNAGPTVPLKLSLHSPTTKAARSTWASPMMAGPSGG